MEHYLKIVLNNAQIAASALRDFRWEKKPGQVRLAHTAIASMAEQLSTRPGIVSETGRLVIATFHGIVSNENDLGESDAAYLCGMLTVYAEFVDSHYYRA